MTSAGAGIERSAGFWRLGGLWNSSACSKRVAAGAWIDRSVEPGVGVGVSKEVLRLRLQILR
jgi:hypothetical protein